MGIMSEYEINHLISKLGEMQSEIYLNSLFILPGAFGYLISSFSFSFISFCFFIINLVTCYAYVKLSNHYFEIIIWGNIIYSIASIIGHCQRIFQKKQKSWFEWFGVVGILLLSLISWIAYNPPKM